MFTLLDNRFFITLFTFSLVSRAINFFLHRQLANYLVQYIRSLFQVEDQN